jgi:hypothetical protein
MRSRIEAGPNRETSGSHLPLLAFVPALLTQDYSLPGAGAAPEPKERGTERYPRISPALKPRQSGPDTSPDR